MTLGVVTISMFVLICLGILHNELIDSVLYWEVCYISFLCTSDSTTAP